MSAFAPSSLLPASPRHLILPFAACNAENWLPTVQALAPEASRHLGQLLQGMQLMHTDDQQAESLSPPHERALARALGLASEKTPDGLLPWAARDAAQHLPGGAGGKAWAWITPCHWAMGHLHATLSDPAALALQEDESRALLAILQPYFETDGITLHYAGALGPGRWLAEGELLRKLPTASLDRVLARNVDAWLPDAPQAAPLRRLQNEMQMLLYIHPFNDARELKRQLPVNSFWISGTGDLPLESKEAPSPASPQGQTEPAGDAHALPATDARPTAPALTATAAQVSAPRSLAQAVFKEDWTAYAQAWQALDANELAPLLTRQRAGETVRLTLCGERSAQTFESRSPSLGTRLSRLFSPLRPLDILQQL
ncbi:MAG: hypothetical protein M3R45_08605 [Pseudomonadota bacterium]|nr:hypothetical protein [Pseudomonadota bacterium]